ncbi:MAG: nucleotidyl transferase AbiEii/AbiGii toxin family protein [Candidatus Omnitrophica bacterium]|nr:nucleotidyl transferase AbiEii/AbiGii toxin family protein [Candidatus Omnitrophota bacterium]
MIKNQKILNYQNKTLKALVGKIDDFYLAGGTALSLFYFQHRLSVDLDFFTSKFSTKRIKEIISHLEDALKRNIKLIGRNIAKDKVKVYMYNICFTVSDVLKVDFVEDIFPLIKKTKTVEGIRILSLEDIYLRKLYAICGVISAHDITGKKKSIGGRAESKDFYDLYYLSHTFMPLSRFVGKYGDSVLKEGLISWFRTYDRMEMMDGLLDLEVDKKINYKAIERYFKKEIDAIIESQIEEI